MAPGDPYISRVEIKSILGITTSDEDSMIDRCCMGATKAIDRRSGWRSFWLTGTQTRTVSTHRRVVPVRESGYQYLKLLLPMGIVTTDVFEVPGYPQATPLDTDELNEGRPVDSIRFPWGTSFGSYGEVDIITQWGWPTLPDDIQLAAQLQTLRYYNRKGSPGGAAGSAEWGIVTIPRLDPDVRAILEGGFLRAGIG